MKINGKPRTPIIAAQSKEKKGQKASPVNGKKGGTKARASRTSKSKTSGVKSVVLERISDGILAFDAGLNYTYLNERAGELLGCKSDELIGRSLWQAHPNADGAPFAEACRRALETQTIVPLDGYFHASDRWLAGRVYPSPEGVSVLFMESPKKRQEEDQGISSLPEQNPNPVLQFTPQGEILYANLAAKTLLRAWENQDAHTTSLSEIQLLLPSVMDEHLTTDLEIKNDGMVYTGLLVPVKDQGYINLYLRDITERKQVEESLRAHEAELQAIIDQTPFMLTRCTRDLHFRFVSRAYAEMIGRTPEEVTGRPIVESLGEEGLKTIAPYIEQVLQGRQVEFETEGSLEGVGVPALQVIYTPDHDEAGSVVGWFASITDVTAHKDAEREKNQLLEREQALRVNAEQARVEAEQAKQKAEEELVERELAEQALGQWADSPMPQEARSPWLRYGLAFAATAAAIGLRILLDPVLSEYVQYTSLFAAVAFSIWYGGLGPALFSAILGYLGVSWFIMDWQHFLNPNAADLAGFVIFLFSTVIIMFLGSAMRRAQRHAHQSARLAVERQRQAELHLIEQKRVEEAFRESEQRFRGIFETAGVSVWVEDFSEVAAAIEELRTQGVQDFRAYFLQNTDFVRKAIDLVRILDVNQETLHLFGAENKDELLHSLSSLFIPETEAVFLEELVALAEGRSVMRAETQLKTLDDRLITVLFTVHFSPQTVDSRRVVVTLTDITERKHMEQALEHERQLFKLLFETMPVMVSLYDPEINSLRLNAEFERVLGWRSEEVTVQSLLEALYPDTEYRNQVLQRMADAGGKNEWVEVQVQARDGRTVDSLWSNISIMNDQQVITGIAIGIDNTERKQAELALMEYGRQQEALYKLTNRLQHTKSQEDIYNAALDAILNALQCDRTSILLFDDTSVMRFVAWRGLSDEYRKATDGHSPWKRDEKNPEPISMDDVDTAELSDSLKAIIKEEGIASLAFIPLVSNGQLIGKFMAYFNTLHDWSDREIDIGRTIAHQLATAVERKRADDALHASEERFAQFMQYLPGLAWIKDMDGRYVYANAAAEKAFGTPREQLYGKTDADVFPLDVAAQFTKNDDLALMEREGVQMIETLSQDDGVLHSSLVTKFPIPGPDGNPAMIGGTAFDITERIQMEGALQQARERAEETADRMARLQAVTASLAEVLTPAQLAELILEQGTRATGAAASVLVELVNDGKELKTVAALGYPEGAIRTEPVPLSERTPMTDCLQKKRAVWIGSHEEFAEHYPSLAELRRGLGNEATVALPLIVGDRVLGGLAFSFVEKREFLLEERGFLLAVAQQCAQGLERANTTEALRESEERYRALINQTTAGIVRKDANGKILFVNDAFCRMLGYKEADLIGRSMWQITHEWDVVENRRLYNRLMAEGTQFELEKRLLRSDGSIRWATVSVSPVLDVDGKPSSAVSVYTDITERKQTEIALNESRERFRNLFNLVPVAVYTCDADGLIQEFNRSAVELWGREPFTNDPSERYCGSFKIYYPDGRFMPHKNCPMARMLRGETLDPSELEILVERQDGSRRNVIAHPLSLKDEHGRIVGAINCLYDMTERKQAESRLTLLAEVSDLTRRIEDSNELMSAVADIVGRYFHVRRSLFNQIDLENNLEIVRGDYHDGIESVEGVHKISDYSDITNAEIMKGKTIVNTDSKADPRTANDYERSYLPTGERAYIAVPLMRDERWVASLWISDDTPRQWSREDVTLLETIAERTWTASEKLRIHTALRDSEERLRVTFNTTAVGFATLTPDTYFVDINEAFCSIVGYPREELLRMSFESLTHPDYLKSTQDHIAALLNGEVPSFTIEKLYVRKDGREVWLQNSLSLVRDTDGNPLHLIAIIQDVTERKQTEDALHQLNLELEARVLNRTAELQSAYEFLRESEATSRLILESMPDAIVITDQDGKIVHANTQVESLFGYSPNEVLGQPVEILLPERYHRQHLKNRGFYASQRTRRIMGLGLDLHGRRRDETEFPVDVMLSPINNNTTWDVMVSIRDNTKQRQAQEALRINEEKLRTLFEILPVGISFLDKEGRINDINPAMTEIVGLTKSELLKGTQKPRQYVRADGNPMPPEELASTRARLEQKTIYNVETGIVQDNGEIRWTSVSAAPVQVAEMAAAVVTVDITERKQAEETLHKHRERLRILSRRLVEVQEEERRAIAHELHDRVGQNLAALTLNLNILRNQLSSEALEKIGTRLNDSVSLVNDILAITRNVMADLRPNVLDDYGLDAALNEYADRFTQRFGIRVSTNFPDTPTPRLDPGIEMTVLRIAQEALTNIARHSRAAEASISVEMDKDAILLKVEDNGTGILSWQKVNQPGSHGLKIMRERAEAFGGTLTVDSAYKSGTVIEARIPLESSTRNKVSQEKRS